LKRAVVLAVVFVTGCGARPEEASPSSGAQRGAGEAPVGVRFVDVTAESGVEFVHDAGASELKHLPETMGHGAALLDADGDGDLDLYLVQSGPLTSAGSRADAPTNRLYTNRGEGTFDDATAASRAAADRGYGMGVAVGDVNGDGRSDLYVTNFRDDRLFVGEAGASFRDATGDSGLREERWTSGATFFDAERDGDLDLYVAAYVQVDLEEPDWCGRREPGWRTVCHPDRYPGLQDRLWLNDGGGRFGDATESAGVGDSHGKGLGVVATDFDDDGFQDLYVANDSVENRLWHNRGDGSFTDETLLSGTGVNRHGATEAGMGLAAGDVDGDGDFDLYVTNFDHESNTLYRNDGGGLFTDATPALGLEARTRMPVGFGTLMMDFDNDSDLDIAVVNGHIVDRIERYHDGQTYRQHAIYFENRGDGHFSDASELVGELTAVARVGRSLVSGDLDGDGDLDLVATECGGPTRVLRNERSGPGGVFLEGVSAGTYVVATTATGKELHREAGPQPSYLGQSSPRVHLGTAGESVVRLELRRGQEIETFELDPPLGPGIHRLRAAERVWQRVR